MKIIEIPLAALKPSPNNPRTHSDKQVEAVCRSIRKFGWTNPVLVKGDLIVAGHCRVLAARRLGLEVVPCVQVDKLTAADVRAYVIADNKLAEQAGWDVDLVRGELASLAELGFEVSLTGFDSREIAQLMAGAARLNASDENEVPAAPVKPISKVGDVWLMGAHRLACGDSTVKDDVARALGGSLPLLMVTDQPYGYEYDAAWRGKALAGGARASGKVRNDERKDWGEAWALFPGRVAYVWHAGRASAEVNGSLVRNGFEIRSQIVWIKQQFKLSRGAYHWQHEPLFYAVRADEAGKFVDGWRFAEDHELAAYAVKDGGKAAWNGGRKQSTVWFIEHRKNESGHSTEKPVECMRRPILNNSNPGQAVYDPFTGSGTTLIACEGTARVFCGLELDPVYVDVAVTRWQAFTGERAKLEAGGKLFSKS